MEFKTDIPIYIQIATQIKEKIMSGNLKPGDKLSSVREYSVMYEVSALTIQRAIQYLDSENIIHTKKGIGSFVNAGIQDSLKNQMIDMQVYEFVEKMRNSGLKNKEIIDLLNREIKEWNE